MRRVRRLALVVGILFIVTIILSQSLAAVFRETGDRLLRLIGSPLWSAGVALRQIRPWADSRSKETRIKMEKEANNLIVENARFREVLIENERLRELLQFQEKRQEKIRLARVIAGSNAPDVHTITINAGRLQGILEGDAVVVQNGLVIGKVAETRSETATVELITDARSRFAASILANGEPMLSGLVEGGHGAGMIMRLIPLDVKISVGDPVISSGIDAGVPRGLILGRVESLIEEPNEPFRKAVVFSPANLDTLTVVAVTQGPR